ncbi:hypothetical protein D3C81_1695470 [compost metagenome]
MKIRDVLMADCRGMVDCRAFGDDQSHPTLRTSAVISGDITARYTTRRKDSGHRGHYNPIGERKRACLKGSKQ